MSKRGLLCRVIACLVALCVSHVAGARSVSVLFHAPGVTELPSADVCVPLDAQSFTGPQSNVFGTSEFVALECAGTQGAHLLVNETSIKAFAKSSWTVKPLGDGKLTKVTLNYKAADSDRQITFNGPAKTLAAKTTSIELTDSREGDWTISFPSAQMFIYSVLVTLDVPGEQPPGPTTHAVTWTTPEHAALIVKTADTALKSGDKVAEGTELTISATAEEGYDVTTIKVNGTVHEATELTHKVTAPTTISVETAPKQGETPEQPKLMVKTTGEGTVKVIDADGAELPTGSNLTVGSTLTVIAAPADNYTISALLLNNIPQTLPEQGKAFTAAVTVAGPLTVECLFVKMEAPKPQEFTVSWDVSQGGAFKVALQDGTELTSDAQVPEATVISYIAMPDAGYKIGALLINGEAQLLPVPGQSSAKALAVNRVMRFDVLFEELQDAPEAYTIRWQTPDNGTITVLKGGTVLPNGTAVERDTELTILVAALPGYRVDALMLNGEPADCATLGQTLQHTVTVTANLTITATITAVGEHAIVIEQIGGGWIEVTDPDGVKHASNFAAADGAELTVKVTPDEGYRINRLTVNDTPYLAAEPDRGLTLTLNVTAPLHLIADFTKTNALDLPTAAADAAATYYDLTGRRLTTPRGLHLRLTPRGARLHQ